MSSFKKPNLNREHFVQSISGFRNYFLIGLAFAFLLISDCSLRENNKELKGEIDKLAESVLTLQKLEQKHFPVDKRTIHQIILDQDAATKQKYGAE